MSGDGPFSFPGGSIPEVLTGATPAAMPGPLEAGDGMAEASPFKEALDIDQIFKNLVLDRPLQLFIPRQIMERFKNIEFHIINTVPHEIAQAQNRGFREVTDPDAVALFANLVAGRDKEGKPYRPMLTGRPRIVGEHVRERTRGQLASLYAGMDPKNKNMESKYTKNVGDRDGTAGQFTGDFFRIRVKARQSS